MRCSTTAASGLAGRRQRPLRLRLRRPPLQRDAAARPSAAASARSTRGRRQELERRLVDAGAADRRPGRAAASAAAGPRLRRRRPAHRRAARSARIDYGAARAARCASVGQVGRSTGLRSPACARRPRERSSRAASSPARNCGAPRGGEARRHDAVDRLPPVQVGDRCLARASAADLRALRRRTNRCEPQIPLGSVGTLAFAAAAAAVAGGRLRPALHGPRAAATTSRLLARVPALPPQRGFAVPGRRRGRLELVAPITGAPQALGEDSVRHGYLASATAEGNYTGREVTYVLGEFYWRVHARAADANSDYSATGAAAAERLNRERTARGAPEVVWSAGDASPATTVVNAFRLRPTGGALQRDARRPRGPRCSARSSSGIVIAGRC